MAQRAIIGINGELTPFDASLDKIRTPGIGASSVTWVPDADTRCTTLRVTANGTYNAAQRGDYGYDYVTVSVPGTSVTGRDPDTGEEVQVGVDPETGDIVETVLATEIRVTTPPTKISYVDGETIDYSGIVVHAYSATGQDMGEVPFSELVFPVSTADAGSGEWTNGEGVIARLLSYTSHWNKYWDPVHQRPDPSRDYQVYISETIGSIHGNPAMWGSTAGPTQFYATVYGDNFYIFGATAERRLNGYEDTGREYNRYEMWSGTSASTVPGRVNKFSKESWITGLPESSADPLTADLSNLHAVQSLPVQWSRTGDGAVLETAFDIQVTPAGGDTP